MKKWTQIFIKSENIQSHSLKLSPWWIFCSNHLPNVSSTVASVCINYICFYLKRLVWDFQFVATQLSLAVVYWILEQFQITSNESIRPVLFWLSYILRQWAAKIHYTILQGNHELMELIKDYFSKIIPFHFVLFAF